MIAGFPTTGTARDWTGQLCRFCIHSLTLLVRDEHLSGLGEWVVRTAAALSPEERERHRLVMIGFYYVVNPARSWPSFPAYLDHLAAVPPDALRDKLLTAYTRFKPGKKWDDDSDEVEVVDWDAVLASVDTFLAFLRERFDHVDPAVETKAYNYILEPPALQDLVVSHLRHMWDTYLAAEWERVRPMLQDAVDAFRQVDFSQMSRLEAAQFVTGQPLEEAHWQRTLERSERLVFIPSAHVGPYLARCKTELRQGIIFGARLPEGTQYHAPDLSRAEILVRLSALADDTRLRILKLVAEEGEQRSQDIISRLELSQSAASRHLQQLTATGYLAERRCEGAKCYRLNSERIENTLRAVSAFLTDQ
ncbi:MAG TPA: winged helix-turn-helix domain-containing protein [Anaerolineae bacterium]